MKKQTIISLFLLFAFSLLVIGCTEQVEDSQNEQNIIETTTVVLVESHSKVVPKTQEVEVSRSADKDLFLRSGVDAIVEFYNNDDESKRLVIYDTNIDLILRPNERAEVKINSEPQTIEYIFGDDYKQIIIA